LAGYLAIKLEAFFKTGTLLEDFAGAFLIGPKIRLFDMLLQVIELLLF
jgi:hypothetical protein